MATQPQPTVPPTLSTAISYRALHDGGAFWQRPMISAPEIEMWARQRQIGIPVLERLDRTGAFQPIAFPTLSLPGATPAARAPDTPAFREDDPLGSPPGVPGGGNARRARGALYSPWQILYLADAVALGVVTVDVDDLLRERERGDVATRYGLGLAVRERVDQCRGLDARWRPVIKLLIAVQNRFWPLIAGRSRPRRDSRTGRPGDPLLGEIRTFDAGSVMADLGLELDDLVAVVDYLAERHRRLDHGDGYRELRRAAPRSARRRWNGSALLAADFDDAALMLARFCRALTGEPIEDVHTRARPRLRPRRACDVEEGAARTGAVEALRRLGLHPASLHVLADRELDGRVLAGLIEALTQTAPGIGRTTLTIAKADTSDRPGQWLEAVADHPGRVVVIAQETAGLLPYARALRDDGILGPKDLHVVARGVEQDCFELDEFVDLIAVVGRRLGRGELAMTADELNDYVTDRRAQARDGRIADPGVVECAIELAASEDHGAVRLAISEISDGIVSRLVAELETAGPDRASAPDERRRLLCFAVERVGIESPATSLQRAGHGTPAITVDAGHARPRHGSDPMGQVASVPGSAT